MEIERSVLVIGAGAAGIGFGIALKNLGIESFEILEKSEIGQNFRNWPKETRFITPSFTSNGFGMPDLNAVAPSTSPGYTLGKEHLSGNEYADYLVLLSKEFKLPVQMGTEVLNIEKKAEKFVIETPLEKYICTYLIMAVGEFSNPDYGKIEGAELGMHYGEIDSFNLFKDPTAVIIGGNESGIDIAVNLSERCSEVTLYTNSTSLESDNPDPSIGLSSYTRERLLKADENEEIIHIKETMRGLKISKNKLNYEVEFSNGEIVSSLTAPILGTGFLSESNRLCPDLFELDEWFTPILTNDDESTCSKNLFLIGSKVRQGEINLCYIYKFRQRFAYVINEIAKREKWTLNQAALTEYKKNNMFLDDYSACDSDCIC